MAKSNKRPLAVVKVKTIRRIGDFILAIRTYALNIANNAIIFTTPIPTVVSVKTNADALETAEALAKTRVQGAVAARDLKYDKSLDDLNAWLRYVQGLADAAPDVATAISIIEASGFGVKSQGVRVKPPLTVKQLTDDLLGLYAKAESKRASYEWQQSSDGIVWTDLPGTLQANTKVTGLKMAEKLFFRVRAITKSGIGNWSAAVSIIVH